MLFKCSLILILINISKEDIEYDDFPLNEEFNIINTDKQNNEIIMFSGNILSYFKIKTPTNEDQNKILNELKTAEFNFKYANFTDKLNPDFLISRCNESSLEEETCIEYLGVAYGEHLFIRFIYLPFLLVFTGVLLCLYGRVHYIFGIFFEFVGCFYFFIIDFIELLFSFDNSVIPFYILSAGILSGFLIALLGKLSVKKTVFLTAVKIIKSCIIGYCFIKSLLYYISIYNPINNVLFFILICLFIILGALGEYFISFKLKTDQVVFILSSVLSGTLYITKGIGYSIGGYYSDLFTSLYDLKYGDDAKSRVTFFLVLHILLIIGALFFQIIDYKNREYEEALTRKNTSKSSNYSGDTTKSAYSKNNNKDINLNNNDNDNIASSLKNIESKESLPGFLSGKSGDNNLYDASNESEEINDQDD